MTIHKYTLDELQTAVSSSTSIRQVLIKLKIAPLGGNNATVKQKIARYNIDTSHFLGSAQKGRPKRLRREINEYLTNIHKIGSHRLKLRLLREGIMRHVCSGCKETHWMGQLIPIELDHIDGNSENNDLQNLRLLCPNCHAFTPTYRSKNQRRTK